MSLGYSHSINGTIQPLRESILVSDMDFGEKKTSGGVIILDDDGAERGIRPRWAKVFAVGAKVDEVKIGEWILIDHGRWTRGIKMQDPSGKDIVVRMVDRKDILLASEENPS